MNETKTKAGFMPRDCAKKSQAVDDILNGVKREPPTPPIDWIYLDAQDEADQRRTNPADRPKARACVTCGRFIHSFCWKCSRGQIS